MKTYQRSLYFGFGVRNQGIRTIRSYLVGLILVGQILCPGRADVPAGTPTQATGALTLAGGGQFVRVPAAHPFDLTNRFTIEIWARFDAKDTRDTAIVTKGPAWQLLLDRDGHVVFQTRQGQVNPHRTRSVAPVPLGAWHHVAAVYDGAAKLIFLNGSRVQSEAYSGDLNFNTEPLHLGASPPAAERFMKGAFDNIRLWSIVRSEAEIRADARRDLYGNEAGLVADWRFNEAAGTKVYDYTPANQHGDILAFIPAMRTTAGYAFNFPPPVATEPHGAIRFDGDDRQRIAVREKFEQAFRLTNALTVEFWVKLPVTPANYQTVVSKGADWGVVIKQNQVMFRTEVNGMADALGSESRLLPDRWHHVATVFDQGQKSLYLDGVLEKTSTLQAVLATSDSPVLFGNRVPDLTSPLEGTLDLIRIWSRARTRQEIQGSLFQQMRGSEPGLLGEWRCDEAEGVVAEDGSFGERDALLVNLGAPANRVEGLHFNPPSPRVATEPAGALRFVGVGADGLSPRVVLATATAASLTEALTIEAWVNIEAWAAPWQAIITKGNAWGLTRHDQTDHLAFRTSLGFQDSDLVSQAALELGRWYHVAAVFDGREKRLYIDGLLDSSVELETPLVANSFPVVLGGNAEALARVLQGRLDNVRLWSMARTDTEIRSHLDRVVRGTEPGLLGEWRLDLVEGQDPAAALDSSLSAAHGVLTDMNPSIDRVTGLALRAPAAAELALAFDASQSNFVELPGSPAFDFPASMTIETWIYFEEFPSTNHTLISKGDEAWQLELLDSGKIQFTTVGLTGSDPELVSSSTLPLREWHHIAAVWDRLAGTKAIYIDGQRDGSVDGLEGQLSVNSLPVLLGAAPVEGGAPTNFFAGRLDEVRLWASSRSEVQIRDALARHLDGTEPSLIGVWDMNEGSGPQILNGKVGFTLHGTLRGGLNDLHRVDGPPLGSAQPPQYALQFDGVDDYVRIPHRDDLNLAPGATLEAWIRPAGSGTRTILWKGSTSYSLVLEANNRLRFYPGDGSSFLSSESVGTNGWQQVAVVVDASLGRILFYINGQSAGSHTTIARIVNNQLDLFLGRGAGGAYFQGQMDEVRLWKSVRTAQDVQFYAERELPFRNPGLAAYWIFAQGDGDEVMDVAGNQLTGFLHNMDPESWGFGASLSAEPVDPSMNLTANPGAQGLWIGQVQLDQVNEVNRAINGVSERTTPTADKAFLRILLHVDAAGRVRLLKDVILMKTKVDAADTNAVAREVLMTNPGLIGRFDGYAPRGNKLVGIRHGTVAYDFAGFESVFQGGLGAGVGCMGTLLLPETHSSNPYRHRYHPEHQKGLTIRREISLQMDGTPGDEPMQTFNFGADRLTGTYRETIVGLHKIALKMAGRVTLNRISKVAVLNDNL